MSSRKRGEEFSIVPWLKNRYSFDRPYTSEALQEKEE